jgi:hypothetical protein
MRENFRYSVMCSEHMFVMPVARRRPGLRRGPLGLRGPTTHARHLKATRWASKRFLGPTAGPTVISASTAAITAR